MLHMNNNYGTASKAEVAEMQARSDASKRIIDAAYAAKLTIGQYLAQQKEG